MNIQEKDILCELLREPYTSQRTLAGQSGHSLGVVNRSLKALQEGEYIDEDMELTMKAWGLFRDHSPRRAVILAAGLGMRMVPINMQVTKGLLKVNGEVLIERIIRQLNEVNIYEIYVVVGFMKEQYEYLIDEYEVELIVNPEYATKNNLHSLQRASAYLDNAYVIPCDIWCEHNPFRKNELYSWYMVSDLVDDESWVRVNRKMELVSVSDHTGGNAMIGIAYLTRDQAAFVREKLLDFSRDGRHDGSFWEETLYDGKRMVMAARVIHFTEVTEINTYEQLREFDDRSDQLKSDVLEIICTSLEAQPDEIVNIQVTKKGMTNRSFVFESRGLKYIMRIPGEGTGQLINRKKEADVYRVIAGQGICNDPIYINPVNGYKISKYIEGARLCDPLREEDVTVCMKELRNFHEAAFRVEHEFDLFGQIIFYESLWGGSLSAYRDYARTKENVFALKPYIDTHVQDKVLTHIDAVSDNFLFVDDGCGGEHIQLIDWEYAGMQDPHVDIAMFCIYALYDREHVEKAIRAYFPEGCSRDTRVKIYCYIAVCGLLWSNWCEYKRNLGVEFGEYSLRQYRYAKDYYNIAKDQIDQMKNAASHDGEGW